MPLKKIAKFSIAAIVLAACVLGIAYYYFFKVYMPNRFQKEILPALMKNAGITGFSGKMKSAGPNGANLGELCIGDPENPTLKIRSVIIKYRFQNIFVPRKPDITSLEFRGLELNCRMKGKRFEINNIDVKKFIEQLKKHFTGKHKKAIGSWNTTKLRISGGIMHLDWDDTKLLLPFELSFDPQKQNWEVFSADLKLTWREYPIEAELTADLEKRTSQIKFKANADLKRILALLEKSHDLNGLSNLKINGMFDIDGDIAFGFSPWKINKMTVRGMSKSCEIHYGVLSLRNRQLPSGMKTPLAISLNTDGGDYNWKLENGFVKNPVNVFLKDFSCRVPRDKSKDVNFDGELEFDFSKLELVDYYDIKNIGELNIIRQVKGRFNRNTKNWQLSTAESGNYSKNSSIKSFLSCGNTKIFVDVNDLEFNGAGCRQDGELTVRMYLKELSGTGQKNAFFCNDAELKSEFKLGASSKGKLRIKKNNFNLSIPEFTCSSLDRQMKIDKLDVSGSNSFEEFKINGFELTAASGKIHIKKNSDLLVGKTNKFSVDGILKEDGKSWEMAVSGESLDIEGRYNNLDFKFENAKSKNFVSLQAPLFKWKGVKNCSVRLQCDEGRYGNDEQYLKASGLKLVSALVFDGYERLLRKTFSGEAAKLDGRFKGVSGEISRLEIAGGFDRKGGVDKNSPEMNLLSSLEAKSISLNHENINYSAKLIQLILNGKDFDELMHPEYLKSKLIMPSFYASRGKDKIKVSDTVLQTVGKFNKTYDAYDWKRSLNSLKLGLAFNGVLGIWEKINVSSSKSRLDMEIEPEVKDSTLYIKKLDADLKSENTVAYSRDWKLAGRKILLSSSGRGSIDSNINLNPKLDLKGFYVSSHDASFNVPEALLQAELRNGKVSGDVSCKNAIFCKNELELICRNISVRLPFGKDAREGKMTVDKVELRKRDFGSVEAKMRVKDKQLLVKASHFSKIFSDASVFFSGRIELDDFPEWEGDFTIPEFSVKNALNTDIMFPQLGVAFVGRAAIEGHLKGNLESCKSSGSISIDDGILNFDKWELSGVSTRCKFTDLFKLKSLPRQKLSCIQAGNQSIDFSKMQVEYQLQGRDRMHIERMAAEWYGGRLTSLGAFALKGNDSDPQKVNFMGSEIVLSPLLEDLGVKGIATDAFVDGIVSLNLKDGQVFIVDASLATKTGRNGFLRLDGDFSRYIESGADESQISQKKFTAAALKRFNYNWLRLNVETSPVASKIKLNIDGYPVKALPFKYDAERAVFEPSSPDEPGLNGDMTIETKFIIPKLKDFK